MTFAAINKVVIVDSIDVPLSPVVAAVVVGLLVLVCVEVAVVVVNFGLGLSVSVDVVVGLSVVVLADDVTLAFVDAEGVVTVAVVLVPSVVLFVALPVPKGGIIVVSMITAAVEVVGVDV